jgi:hypothetical protein
MSTPQPPAPELSPRTEGNILEGAPSLRLPVPTSGQLSFGDSADAAHQRDMEKLEKEHQHKKEEDERQQSFKKEDREDQRRAIAQWAAMGLIVLVGLACLWVIISNRYASSTVDKAWAALAIILSGFVGFVVGQNVKK